jgi:hypothetical protein
MAQDFLSLVWQARKQVAYTNGDFAKLTGVSKRTVERHSHNGGISFNDQTHRLIAAVHPQDPQLASQLADAAGTTLAALGLKAAPSASDARPEHADSVLVAAANALALPPEAVRPAVAAAFSRALALGVSLHGLAEHLSRPPAATNKPKGATKAI